MDRVEQLIFKAKAITEPKLKSWERAMQHNRFVGGDNEELLELLTVPQDDWRLIVQAIAWNGGVVRAANKT